MCLILIFIFVFLFVVIFINVQIKKEWDIKVIKSMCGCYEVGFNFVEIFNYFEDLDYKVLKVKNDKVLEYV